jgi:hypothetical protein
MVRFIADTLLKVFLIIFFYLLISIPVGAIGWEGLLR